MHLVACKNVVGKTEMYCKNTKENADKSDEMLNFIFIANNNKMITIVFPTLRFFLNGTRTQVI
jgi:hypothetical protein